MTEFYACMYESLPSETKEKINTSRLNKSKAKDPATKQTLVEIAEKFGIENVRIH